MTERAQRDLRMEAARVFGLVAVGAVHFVFISSIAASFGTPEFERRDWSVFRTAGARVWDGAIDDLYAVPAHGFPFLHPPAVAVLSAPLAALSPALAYACLLALEVGCLGIAMILLRRVEAPRIPQLDVVALFTLASAPWLISILLGQPSAVLLLIFVAGLASLARRPFVSGLLFSLAALKPTFLVPVVLFAALSRDRRALLGLSIGIVSIAALGLLLGLDAQLAWLAAMRTKMADTSLLWKQHTLLALLRYSLPSTAALIVYASIAIPVGVWVMIAIRREGPTLRALGWLALATVSLSPYLYDYDALILVLPLAAAWRDRSIDGRAPRLRLSLALALFATQYAVFFALQSGPPLACIPTLAWLLTELGAFSRRNR